jgi:hypothetical protein
VEMRWHLRSAPRRVNLEGFGETSVVSGQSSVVRCLSEVVGHFPPPPDSLVF